MSYLRPNPEFGATGRAAPALREREREREPQTPPMHDARVLTNGGQEARIVLDGAVYTLRVTRLRKLILTK